MGKNKGGSGREAKKPKQDQTRKNRGNAPAAGPVKN
jgi:hypothetical protein